MLMAAYNDFFNTDNKIKGSSISNKDTKILKNQILKSVRSVIEKDKRKSDLKNKD